MSAIEPAGQTIRRAIQSRVFPAAAVDVGSSAGPLWQDAFGAVTFDEGAAPATMQTPFDLASVTKVVATTTLLMQLVAGGAVGLEDLVAAYFPDWVGHDREAVTIRDLLEHASGLPARLIDPPPDVRREFEHDICTLRLEYQPRAQSIYSDLDFILLGFMVADRGGSPLAAQFEQFAARLDAQAAGQSAGALTFELPADLRRRAAPTVPLDEDARRGRTLVGEVHDNYAAALGGAAGHAGLFATAPAVGAFARAVLRAARGDASGPPPLSPAIVRQFTTRSAVRGSSRALGWDTMLPTSSCGTRMSAAAFGHVGFTGTSLWIDPARDRYFVLLTNRAYGHGTRDQMRAVRRAFHDALGDL